MAMVALVMTIASASAQRLVNINVEAQYITDKMIVELGLSRLQRSSILQLNLNYLNGITCYRDIDSHAWKHRNKALKAMMSHKQWELFRNAYYFYRPIGWRDGDYVHNIYDKYPRHHGPGKPGHDRKKFDRGHRDMRPEPRGPEFGPRGPQHGPRGPEHGPRHDKGPRDHHFGGRR